MMIDSQVHSERVLQLQHVTSEKWHCKKFNRLSFSLSYLDPKNKTLVHQLPSDEFSVISITIKSNIFTT